MNKSVERIFERTIFASRWLQAPLYGGLIVASALYAYKFLKELVHLCMTVNSITEEVLMLGVLTLVDITMVANLLIMVIVGGYATFVSKIHLDDHEDRPEWLEKINAGTLKVKLAGALVGVSGIHLLKAFINVSHKTSNEMFWQVVIHVVFLFSTLMLAWSERIMQASYGKKAAS